MSGFLLGGYGPEAGGSARGIGRARLTDGGLVFDAVVAELPSPSWIVERDGVVYAALESTGEIASLRLDGERLTLLSRHPTAGKAPCHLALLDGALVVACYGTGELGVHPLAADGSAGELVQSLAGEGSGPRAAQAGPHAHHVLPLTDGRLLSLDLGADRVHLHTWASGRLERVGSIPLPPGTGPRDAHELPDGAVAVLGEWSCELLLLMPEGPRYRLVGSARVWPDDAGCQAAGLQASADGSILYAGIRGADRVAAVARSGEEVRLLGTVPSGGEGPRHLLVHGSTLHVAHRLSNTIASFHLDRAPLPEPVGAPRAAPAPSRILPVGGA